jgi:hypothetical protein
MKKSLKRCVIPYLTAAFFLVAPELSAADLIVHGFLSQGYFVTEHAAMFTDDSRDGSF